MKEKYGEYTIHVGSVLTTGGKRWFAVPDEYGKLPYLYSNVSTDQLKGMVDFVVTVPKDVCPKGDDMTGWDALLKQEGISV